MYYPKSQIKDNLYTNGGEFYLETTNEEYKGYYFKTSTGNFFTGKNPNDLPNIKLLTINDDYWNLTAETQNGGNFQQLADNVDGYVYKNQYQNPLSVNTYNALNNTSNTSVIIPYYNPTLPTENDYNIGEFRRYFCKKTNEIRYIEIDKNQFDLLVEKNSKILWVLYQPFFLNWGLSGDKQQVARTNKNITELTSQREKLPKFGDYLKHDYLKYYK